MSLNVVTNNQPTHAIAVDLIGIPSQLNQPAVGQPPGASGFAASAITSQLARGNPGGVGAPSGLGITVDVGA